ncbi:MAG: glycoside hydrolase family 9 protein [Chitinophagaceae bacterium]|nr:glycoside hydrolase family 9 protein [Chitinophagaceae bacterium]
MRTIFKLIYLTVAVIFLTCNITYAQVDKKLKEELQQTGFIHHSLLPLDETKSFEAFGIRKKVLNSIMLCDMEDISVWSHKGIGKISQTAERSKSGKYSLRLHAPATSPGIPDWGLGRGTCLASFDVGGANWEKYNRLTFYIYPNCEGDRSIYLNLYVENDGITKVPDVYGREGYHEINLKNNQWNECFLEITGLARDKVTKISFAIETFGKELTMGDSLIFDVDAVALQTIENPETVRGWKPAQDRIILSTTGYRTESKKTAIVNVEKNTGTFQLKDAQTKKVVYTGKIQPQQTQIGLFNTIDFSNFKTPGQYIIQAGNVETLPFYIDKDVWDNSVWRMINFLYAERCGFPVPGKHGACHTDLHANFNGKIIPINGGWHDAADMSQQTLQTGEISLSLMQMADRAKQKNNTQLYNRLMEEALWGMDFVMRSRLGDGYRAQSWGTNFWTDGIIGTIDDTARREVHVYNGALENFLLAGIEAYASKMVERDQALKSNLEKIAIQDFDYAMERFSKLGFAELVKKGGGHAGMASQSQYMANISWAASMLYKLTGDKKYADEAAKAIDYVLQCQRIEPLKDKDGLSGFFYRDLDKKSIVHYTHQSRDYAYMEALAALCETQPNNAAYTKWAKAIQLYGKYLKNIMQYVQPYGMVPSGVYHRDEVKDSVNFYAVQVGIRSGATNDYKQQFENGIKLDEEHRLRFFPVWFSFKGNGAVTLATGKAAAICAKFLNDNELKNIAEQQLFWIVGKNPFGQSLIYGEGSNYPQLYTALPGETVGGIPVGMQSYFNEDRPYWPQFNTATYKELWGAPAARWLMLVAEF